MFFFIKNKQRGPSKVKVNTEQAGKKITIDPIVEKATNSDGFNRNTNHIYYSKHARCRMDCRFIDESEVKEILTTGTINYSKMESDERGKTYPLEGITHDKQRVRIVFAPRDDGVMVVTCIDLDKDWPCNCK